MSCYPMLYRKYFGTCYLATLMGSFYAAGGLGMTLGGLLGGVFYDVFGSYHVSFAISLMGGVGAAIVAMTLQPPNRSFVEGHKKILQSPTPVHKV